MLPATLFLCGRATAADKSGVSPNAISLPKGPGSIEGLGESFQPSLNTGTAKYGIGIKLPPGVAGHQPSLGLRYEGGGGNGPLGFGWSLSMSSIQRRTDKGIPTYGADVGFKRTDVFINESKEELVPQADGFFFCKNEGAFVRYRFVPSAANPAKEGHWEATASDGTKLLFGLTASSRIEETSSARTFSWLLERETDTRGNVIEYGYRSFTNAENLNQKYLATVRYGPGAPPWTSFHFVTFSYEDRPDWFEDGRAGFLVRTGKRLKTVFVGTQGVQLALHLAGDFDGDGKTDFLNRRYDLDYLRYAGNASHWSLLEKVTLVGADGVTALPPARHRYTVCHPPVELSAKDHLLGTIAEPAAVMDNELVELIDLNADGLPDVLRTQAGGGAHTVWVNRGPVAQPDGPSAILWATPTAVDPGNGSAWNFDLSSDQTHLADMDGDGLADLVRKGSDDSVFFFTNRGKLGWGERQEMALQDSSPPAPFGRDNVRLADLDFDKRMDIIQSVLVGDGVLYRIWFNTGNQTYSRALVVSPLVGFDFATPGVQIADCNGDRVPDLYRIQPNSLVALAGLGYGQFAEAKIIPLPDITLDDEQLRKTKLADINGDGLADLVLERASPGECWYWLNLGNYTFSPRKRIIDLPITTSPTAAVRWADLNGNGTTDLIYADSQGIPRIQAVEIGELLNCAPAPNMLLEIDNGIGRVTRIEYAPSTRFALEDEAAGKPWPDPLPFPVTVVASVTVSDSLGHEYVTRMRYHDGYYDPVEKQFRGFARAEQIDVGDPTAPTLVSRSYFDVGRAFEPMKGRLLRATIEQTDGKVFSDDVTTWVNPPRTLMVGTNGEAVRYVHPVSSMKQILELGQGVPRKLEMESAYDNYGNQTRAINYGIVEGTNRAAFNDERVTTTEYALNTNAWIIRASKRHTVQDEKGAVIARSESFYDDETFSGNNFGVITIGNLTLKRDWIDPANETAFVQYGRTKYDAFGNPIAVFDPLSDGTGNAAQGHFREMTFDSRFHSYPIRETIHVGGGKPDLVFQAAYDEGHATVTASTDFNGHTTTYGYDGLARLARVVKPFDTEAFPTTEYDYALAVRVPLPGGGGQSTGIVNFVETRALDRAPETPGAKRDHYLISRQFTDGLGRALLSKTEAEPATGGTAPRVTVSGAVQFNARQKPACALSPFFTVRGASLEELLAFENIEEPGWQGLFHENGNLIPLNLAAAHRAPTVFDATLRAVRTTNPDGTFTRAAFEPLITKTYDENDTDPASPFFDTPMVQYADGLGRMIRVDEVTRLNDDGTPAASLNSWNTRYEYDLNDRLTRITDSQGNVKVMHYDGLRRKLSMNDPDAGVSTNRYDAASNLIEAVDAKGQRITYTYDGINRMLTEDYHDENSPEFSYHRSPDVIFHYDAPAASLDQGDGTRATARNTKGAVAYIEDTTGEEHTSFDPRGRVEWTVKRVLDPEPSATLEPASATLVSYRTAFEYDSMDRVTRLIYPDNDEVTYRYNARSLLEIITGGPSGSILSGVGYLPSSQQERINYGNGVRTTYAYDKRARLTRLNTLAPPTGGSQGEGLIDFAYTFDNVSNIREIRDQRSLAAVPAADKRRNTQTFAYDDLYRLTQVRYNPSTLNPQPSTNFINYRYDRLGNMLAQTSDIVHLDKGRSVTDLGVMSYGGVAGRMGRIGRNPGDPPGPHALSEIRNPQSVIRNYRYDASGSMTEIDGLRCTWDFLDRLVGVEDDTMRAEYRYDFTGRRIIKRVTPRPPPPAARPSASLYPSEQFEVREHNQPTKYVINGGTRVARITGSLSSHARLQRIRVVPGWNLISLAVTAIDLAGQFQQSSAGLPSLVGALYRWNPANGDYSTVLLGQTVPVGSVLWVKASTNATLAVTGNYAEPGHQPMPAGGNFFYSAGLEVLPLLGERAGVRADVALSHFDGFTQRWQQHLPSIPFSDSTFPKFLSPGAAIFAHVDSAGEVMAPEATLRILYYHQDHLGSSGVMTDADGALVEETAFYPFGEARNEHQPRQVEDVYKFTQKERDRESGLHYFEARFLASLRGRFLSVDPKYAALEAATPDPQQLNLYAYARNNPVLYVDPTGLGELGYGEEGLTPDYGQIGEHLKNDVERVDWDRVGNVAGGALLAAGGVGACGTLVGCVVGAPMIMAGSDRIAAGLTGGDTSLPADFHTGMDYVATVVGGYQLATAVARGAAAGSANTGARGGARSAFDPLADTQAGGPFADTAPMGGNARVAFNRAPTGKSGAGSMGGSGGRPLSIGEPGAPMPLGLARVRLEAYGAILDRQKAALRGMQVISLNEGLALRFAFEQANTIWRATYGTAPPIR